MYFLVFFRFLTTASPHIGRCIKKRREKLSPFRPRSSLLLCAWKKLPFIYLFFLLQVCTTSIWNRNLYEIDKVKKKKKSLKQLYFLFFSLVIAIIQKQMAVEQQTTETAKLNNNNLKRNDPVFNLDSLPSSFLVCQEILHLFEINQLKLSYTHHSTEFENPINSIISSFPFKNLRFFLVSDSDCVRQNPKERGKKGRKSCCCCRAGGSSTTTTTVFSQGGKEEEESRAMVYQIRATHAFVDSLNRTYKKVHFQSIF